MAFVPHHLPFTQESQPGVRIAAAFPQRCKSPNRAFPVSVIDAFNKMSIDADLDNPAATGSFGDIFFGTIDTTNEPVVLKRARSTPNARALFTTEKRINRKLDSGNGDTQAVRRWPEYLGDYVRDSQSFIVWRKCGDGSTLQDYLSGKPLSALCEAFNVFYNPNRVLQYQLFCQVMRSILLALKQIHDKKVVHRDVKPSNILIVPDSNADDVVRLIDFGSGCDVSALFWWSRGIDTIDPLYCAPEKRLNLLHPMKFDVFSAGLIGISVLMPSFSTQTRISEFRNSLAAVDFDLRRFRKQWMDAQKGNWTGANLNDADAELSAFFNQNNSVIFNLLCGMLKKSPSDRTSVDSALYNVPTTIIEL